MSGARVNLMALIVQKFGGTSVSHLGPIRRVARRVKAELEAVHGDLGVAVPSNRGGGGGRRRRGR